MQARIASRTRSKLPLRDTPLPLLEGMQHLCQDVKVIVLFAAALEIPEVMPTVDQQGKGEDTEWQRWLQELFCCGKVIYIEELCRHAASDSHLLII